MSKIKFKAAIACLVIFSILFSTNLPVITLAQTNSDPVVELPGTVSPDLGAPASPPPGTNAPTPQDPAEAVIVLTPRNELAFQALSEAVQDPASPRYRQPVTDAEYRLNYAPDAKTIGNIKSYFAGQGLNLDYESPSGLVLSFKGTLAQRDKAFSTSSEFRGNAAGETGLINVVPLKLPVSLAKNIKGVLGFDQLHVARSNAVGVKPGPSPNGVQPNSVSQNSPASLRSIYNIPSDLNGTGAKVGIVLWTAPDLVNNTNRWKADNGITGSVTLIAVDPASNMTPDTNDLEAHMDIQLVLSAATNASVRYYVAKNNFFDSLGVALQKAVDDNVNSLSSSWGTCETSIGSSTRQAYSTIFQNAAAKGIPVFFSSGDSGAFECNSAGSTSVVGFSQFPAGDPQVTSVGGTSLDHNGNNTWNNETAWSCTVGNDSSCLQSNGGSSTGGATVNYTRPSYQSSITPPTEGKFTNTASNTRVQPDISTNGDPSSGEPIYTNGCTPGGSPNCFLGGGTSASAPFMAGIAALAVQKKNGMVGGINSFVYSNFPNNWGFDVTSGYNGVTAKVGWDYTTGKGSIKDVTAFLNAFVIPAPFLTATLAPIIEIAGNGNGAVDPGEMIGLQISLANTGSVTATSVSGTLSLTGGTANITGATSGYSNIAVNSSATNSSNYVFSTLYTQTCGNTLSFQLTVSYNTSLTYIYNFNLKLGSPQVGSTANYSNNTAVAIPDNNGLGVNSVINVPTIADASDVNVTVNITHSYDGDLALKLTSPNNATINLSLNRGVSGDNYTGTIFDSQAGTPISSGSPPFTGSFQPEQLLNVLNNNPVNGNWTLNVADTAIADTGTLNNWSLAIKPITYTCTVYNPVPTLSSLSQTSTTLGSGGFTLTVNGTNFVNGANPSVVRWNGSNLATAYVSSTQLTAQILASDLMTAGSSTVTVFNPAPGGGTSNGLAFTVNNPVPTVSGLTTPAGTFAGNDNFTLTVNGTNFISSSTVLWNGSARPTTFVNSTQLTAQINAADVSHSGSFPVTVQNPAPGGGTSGSQSLTLVNRAPTITDTVPGAVVKNTALTLTIDGTYFVTNTTVLWAGSPRTATYLNNHQLTINLSAADTATAGNVIITVTNPSPGGGNTTTTFTVSANCTDQPLVVTKSDANANDITTCGYLRYALVQAGSSGTVTVALTSGLSISLANQPNQPLTIPVGVKVNGVCTPTGPGITINGSATANSLVLGGGNILTGLKFMGFGGENLPQLKIIASPTGANKLTCSKISKT